MWHRVDGVAAALSREDAIAATAVSDTPRRPRRGPNGPEIEKETTHGIVRRCTHTNGSLPSRQHTARNASALLAPHSNRP